MFGIHNTCKLSQYVLKIIEQERTSGLKYVFLSSIKSHYNSKNFLRDKHTRTAVPPDYVRDTRLITPYPQQRKRDYDLYIVRKKSALTEEH